MKVSINKSAPVIAEGKIEIRKPVSVVWNVLTGISDWPSWQEAVSKADLRGPLAEDTVFLWKAGGLNFRSRIHTIIPETEFGWTGETFGAAAVHNWRFSPSQLGTLVEVEESLEGFMPALFKGMFQRNLNAAMKKQLEELKAEAERRAE
jgi:hypothetical protein